MGNRNEERTAAELINFIFPSGSFDSEEQGRAFMEIIYAVAYEEDKNVRDNLACELGGLIYQRTPSCATGEMAFLETIPRPYRREGNRRSRALGKE
jgi:hypothetical protein